MSLIGRLQAAGHTVKIKRGTFKLPMGAEQANPSGFVTACEEAVIKFQAHYEGLGWTQRSESKVKRVRMADEETRRVVKDTEGKVTLLMSADTGMRTDHPWFVPDADQYEVTAWFSVAPPDKPIVFELPDERVRRLVSSGNMPTNIKLAE